ncbi:hypothetical protein Tco_0531932 [Tanacetum coccineum]
MVGNMNYLLLKKAGRRNEIKARGTLLMALPNKDQLKFHSYKMQNYSWKPLRRDMEGRKQESRKRKKLVYSSECLENQSYNKSKSDKGYHAVPPPYTGNFIPFKPNLTFMDEIVKSKNLDVTTVVTPSKLLRKLTKSIMSLSDVKIKNGDAVETKMIGITAFRPPAIRSDILMDCEGNSTTERVKEKEYDSGLLKAHSTGTNAILLSMKIMMVDLFHLEMVKVEFLEKDAWYSMVSKAMGVFNKRMRIIEETLNIRFLESEPNVTGNGLDWLFDVDFLSKSMKLWCRISQDPKVSEEDAEEKHTEWIKVELQIKMGRMNGTDI